METKKDPHLSLEERQILYSMLGTGEGFSRIAKVLGRDRSTLRREYKRNSTSVYVWSRLTPLERAKYAHDKALQRRSDSKRGKKGPLKLVAIRDKVEELLKVCRYTPEEIAILLRQGDTPVKVSGKTIRRWILKDAKELQECLAFRGRKRRNQVSPKKPQKAKGSPSKRNISERPDVANSREEVGHKECDFVTCSQSSASILVCVERKTRNCWLRKVKNREAETTRASLMGIESNLSPVVRKSATFDNDPGFQRVFEVERLLGVECYFCDPYCSWQKGSVEHLNRRLRRFFPKGTDLSSVTQERLNEIEKILNARPMECLGELSPDQCWALELEKAKLLLH